jgi:hypothetical protein
MSYDPIKLARTRQILSSILASSDSKQKDMASGFAKFDPTLKEQPENKLSAGRRRRGFRDLFDNHKHYATQLDAICERINSVVTANNANWRTESSFALFCNNNDNACKIFRYWGIRDLADINSQILINIASDRLYIPDQMRDLIIVLWQLDDLLTENHSSSELDFAAAPAPDDDETLKAFYPSDPPKPELA